MTGLLCPQGGINHSCGETPTLLLLPQFTCTQESSSTLPCRRRENPPSVESVGSLAPLLELKLMLSKSQPLFYTSCQRATHEYVWRGGRSHNLCKVSSCIMQPIYASTGCESTQEYTHTHTHTFSPITQLYCDEKVNKPPNLRCSGSHNPEVLVPNHKHLLYPYSRICVTPDLYHRATVIVTKLCLFLDLVLPVKGQRWDLT